MRLNFDPAETGWSLTLATIEADATAPTQPNALHLQPSNLAQNGQASRTLSGLVIGQSYEVYVRINWDDEPATNTRVQIRYNSSTRFTLQRDTGASGWELRSLGSFTCDQADRLLAIVRPDQGSGAVRVDELAIGEALTDAGFPVAKLREIRNAVVARVGEVLVGNGYQLSIGKAMFGPLAIDGITRWPNVQVWFEEGNKDVRTFGRKNAEILMELHVLCKRTSTTDPDDQCMDACAEIEKALEITRDDDGDTVHMLGLSYVQDVVCGQAVPVKLPEDQARDVRDWRMPVLVRYSHDRRDP